MTAVDRAAVVIATTLYSGLTTTPAEDPSTWYGPNVAAAALADAGLLTTDEMRELVEAAAGLPRTADTMTDPRERRFIAALNAYLAARPS